MERCVDPTRDQFAAPQALPRAGTIHMLNLVRARVHTAYPDGRDVSGADAYQAMPARADQYSRMSAVGRPGSVGSSKPDRADN